MLPVTGVHILYLTHMSDRDGPVSMQMKRQWPIYSNIYGGTEKRNYKISPRKMVIIGETRTTVKRIKEEMNRASEKRQQALHGFYHQH